MILFVAGTIEDLHLYYNINWSNVALK